MIRQFTKYGYATISQSTGIGTSYSVIPLTGVTGNRKSAAVPDDCFLESIEIELSNISSGDTITIFLARDINGLKPLTSDQLGGATQAVTLGAGSSTVGGVSFTINKDYHFDFTTNNVLQGTLYLVAKASATCDATNIRLNWRG